MMYIILIIYKMHSLQDSFVANHEHLVLRGPNSLLQNRLLSRDIICFGQVQRPFNIFNLKLNIEISTTQICLDIF